MGVSRIEDLVAYHFAGEFKLEVYGLINTSPEARRDFKFKAQLQDAASGIEATISEGFARINAGDFAVFLRYALASLAEAKTYVKDGVDRGYFREADCRLAFVWAERSRRAILNLHATQRRFIAEDKARKRRKRTS